MFLRLESSSIAMWVAESLWAYPILLAIHIVGLAIVVGIFSMRDLRLLGMFPGIHPAAFLPLSKMAWIGFIINAISGILLFTSQAVTFVGNVPFLLKIAAIIAGMVLAGIIQSRLRGELAIDSASAAEANNADYAISDSTKYIALVSLLLWMAAIVAGRLIAYI
ncbi:MAG: hypothetical protein HOF74_10745 [Gammaproteobacteria bacterium]|jgi:hypothetical protein|nr:hypothetical protein [Gammaproteobacteria bacterium]MBT3860300.1 hypothetical protein [Gammaproteobacteria bacterium]MBT3987592.1 hypothetical protein [Gammaproteobacteria bacterium]MBT4255916.1 hypothetical protein [Gammaproteobacteria bacterium]MBT4581670.1 hypothetical protein [Gammaproteobacteria bacterium]